MGNGHMDSNNNQNIKVVIPPRPSKKAKAEPESAQGNTQPVRVSIPPRHDRKAAPQPQVQIQQGIERTPNPSSPVQVQIPPRAGVQNRVHTNNSTRAEMSFEQLAQLASSVVMIMVHDKFGEPLGAGSGIMIGRKGYILTNAHVLSEGNSFTIRIENDNNCYKTDQVIKYNQNFDLGVIRIDRELSPLPIYKGPQKLVRGQKVVAIGSPLGLFNSVSDGIISGFRSFEDVDMIQYTAPTSPGSSGGAVLNMYGEVIGISQGGVPEVQSINWAVGYEFIHLFTQAFIT
ncbi:MAG: serine protease [Lachnospiraceae bacterium]|nr:serine protease [Lachnospiraceae bacterium]